MKQLEPFRSTISSSAAVRVRTYRELSPAGKGSAYKSQLTGPNKIAIRVNHSALGFDKGRLPEVIRWWPGHGAKRSDSPRNERLRLPINLSPPAEHRRHLAYLNPPDRFAPFHDYPDRGVRDHFSEEGKAGNARYHHLEP